MKLKLSKKLKAIAKLVKGKIIADVGCDHGYLSIYLALTKKVFVYAADLRKNPLKIAQENAKKYNVIENIKFILSDGLKNLPKNYDCVVLAGMGGKLIQRIVFEEDFIKNENVKIIIQPQSFLYQTRINLFINGFEIEKEVLVFEKNKSYVILVAKYVDKKRLISLKEAVIGKLLLCEKKDYEKFLFNCYVKEKAIVDGLKKAGYLQNKEIKKHEEICKILKKWGNF